MAKITQQISNFPPAPNTQTQTPIEFSATADAWVHHQGDQYTPEVNTWATQANGLGDDMNNTKDEIDAIVANLPPGTINDTNIGQDKVFSNQKTEADYKITSGVGGSGISWVSFPDGTLMLRGIAVLIQEAQYSHIARFSQFFGGGFIGSGHGTGALLTPPSGSDARDNCLLIISVSGDYITVQYVASSGRDLSSMWGLEFAWQAIGRWK